MFDGPMYESVKDVWIVWLASTFCVVLLMYRALARLSWKSFARFTRDESGASYVLPYIMTLPWMMLLFCVMIQSTLILLVKFGTVYAAYASARSLVVWDASDPESDDKSKSNARYHADRAAMLAMTPFASGYSSHLNRIFPGVLARTVQSGRIPRAGLETVALDTLLRLYRGAYQRLGASHNESSGHSPILRRPNSLLSDQYVRNKLIFAAMATSVAYDDKIAGWNEDRKVSVKFIMPMHIPGAARFLANQRAGSLLAPTYMVREVTTTISLPSESPKTDNNQLNVPYFPSFLTRYAGL